MTFPQRLNGRGFIEFTDDIQTLVKCSIHQILGTKIGERVMLPEFGSRLHELQFEPIDDVTIALARVYTIEAIEKWEPRAELNDVDIIVNPDQNRVEIYGSYVIANRNITDAFAVAFPRLITGGV
jgi:phage baseplate assembly protein W